MRHKGSEKMSYWAIWLMIVILLSIIEVSTVNLVSVWFIASGIFALFTSLFCDSFLIQFGVFVLLGIVFLVCTRPILKRILKKKEEEKINLERVIGMEGIVTKDISSHEVGEVKVDGKLWSAISDTDIFLDEVVVVKEIQSVKLVVEKVPQKKTTKPKKESTQSKKKSTSTASKKKTSSTKKNTSTNASIKKSSTKKTTSSENKKGMKE